MKCFLILLALGLVASDKLDRTYLPPPGAKFSGGSLDDLHTPLEFPIEAYPGSHQNANHQSPGFFHGYVFTESSRNYEGLNIGIDRKSDPRDYSSTILSNDRTGTIYSDRETVNGISKLKSFNPDFLSFPMSVKTEPKTTLQTITDGSKNFQNLILNGYPNYDGNGQISGNEPSFLHRIATSDDIAPNYQPSFFGYYGGNPMVMISQSTFPQQFTRFDKNPEKYDQITTNIPLKNSVMPNLSTENPAKIFLSPSIIDTNKNTFDISGNSEIKISSLPKTEIADFSTTVSPLNNSKSPVQSFPKYMAQVRPIFKPERPTKSEKNAATISYDNIITPKGFSYSFDTSNGIHADETSTATDGVKARGSYSYTGDDGNIYSITYTADEYGFRPVGNHLPTPPPIPEAIKKIIEKVDRDKVGGSFDDGSYDEKKYGHMKYHGAMERYRPFTDNGLSINQRTDGGNVYSNNRYSRPENNEKINDKKTDPNLDTPPLKVKTYLRNGPKAQFFRETTDRYFKRKPISSNLSLFLGRNDGQQRGFKNNQDSVLRDKLPIKHAYFKTAMEEKRLIHMNGQKPSLVRTFDDSVYKPNQNKDGPQSDSLFYIKNPRLRDRMQNKDTFISNNYNKEQPSKIHSNSFDINKINTSSANEKYNDGYFYVPPTIDFEKVVPIYENLRQLQYKKPLYTATGRKTEPNFSVTEQENFNRKLFLTQIPSNKNIIANLDIDDLDKENKISEYDAKEETLLIPGRNDESALKFNNMETFYTSTTPITPLREQYSTNNTDTFPNQFYQATIGKSTFEQTDPRTDEKAAFPELLGRLETQDFSTTFRPPTFNEGTYNQADEVVNVDGFGRPIQIDTQGYPDRVAEYNDELFTTKVEDDTTATAFYNGKAFQRPEVINKDQHTGKFASESITNPNTENYYNGNSKTEHVNNKFGAPSQSLSGDSVNDLTNSGLPPEQKLTTPNYFNKDPEIIGENFSRPKQPQKFDPVTGYHY